MPPYSWSIVSGALPPGLNINTTTSEISGKPNRAGTFTFTAQLKDSIEAAARQRASPLSLRESSPGLLVPHGAGLPKCPGDAAPCERFRRRERLMSVCGRGEFQPGERIVQLVPQESVAAAT